MAEDDRSRLLRPESTVAQSFAADLDSMFGLSTGSSGLDSLSQTVEEKKANVSSGQSELEKLEAKLRETEQRLAKVSRQNSPSRQADTGASKENAPVSDSAGKQTHPLAQKPTYPDERPPTGGRPQAGRENTDQMMAGMPGAMPHTPDQVNGREGLRYGRQQSTAVEKHGSFTKRKDVIEARAGSGMKAAAAISHWRQALT